MTSYLYLFVLFIQLIWWIRTCQIFQKFDQTKMFQVFLYTLSNLFDSANLIKLIWPCISGNLSLQITVTFVFLKTLLVNVFVKICISVNLFVWGHIYQWNIIGSNKTEDILRPSGFSICYCYSNFSNLWKDWNAEVNCPKKSSFFFFST